MTELTQAAVKAKANPTVRDMVQAQQSAIEVQLAGALNSEAFTRAAISSIAASSDLQQASPATVLGSIMLAAQLKLEIGPALGHFYLTPRKQGGNQVCVPIIGYQGYIELAYRSGRIEKIETFLVRDGDLFTMGGNSERGTFFDWQPVDYEEKRTWIGVVAVAKLKDAGTVFRYLPREQVLERRPGHWQSTPWKTNEEAMARKTAIRALAPYLPKSTDLGRALQADEQKVESIAGVHDLVITPDTEPLELAAPETVDG